MRADIADRHRPLADMSLRRQEGDIVTQDKPNVVPAHVGPETLNRSDLETAIKKAASASDLDLLMALTDQLKAIKAAELKAAAERVAQERVKINAGIIEAIKPVLEKFAPEVIRLGGVLRITYNATEKLVDAALGEKAKSAAPRGSGGANAGKTSEQYGRTLDSIFKEFATAEEQAAHDAEPDNTKRWNLKKKVRTRADEAGLIAKVA